MAVEIDSIVQSQRIGPSGALIDVLEVSWSDDATGDSGTVRVDQSTNWETQAWAAIEAAVAQRATLRQMAAGQG